MARLTRLYTRSGDAGQTGLADGRRLAKSHPRIEALGDLDELNAALGLVRALGAEPATDELLASIQQRLFDLGGELALPGSGVLSAHQVAGLEETIDNLNAALPPLREFLVPGGPPAAAQCHCARALCRRAERSLWRLAEREAVNSASLKYINRLSDLLFVVARHLARGQECPETTWNREP